MIFSESPGEGKASDPQAVDGRLRHSASSQDGVGQFYTRCHCGIG